MLYQRGDDDEEDEEDNDDGGKGHNDGLPDFGDQFDDDDDIQELIKGSNGLKNEDLYQKLKKVV